MLAHANANIRTSENPLKANFGEPRITQGWGSRGGGSVRVFAAVGGVGVRLGFFPCRLRAAATASAQRHRQHDDAARKCRQRSLPTRKHRSFPCPPARGEPPSPGSITAPTGAPKAGAKFAEFAFYEVE